MSIQAINNISFTAKDKAAKAPKTPKAPKEPRTPGIGGKSKGYESLFVPGLGQYTDKRKSAGAKFFTGETFLAAVTGVELYLFQKAEKAEDSIVDELSDVPEALSKNGKILYEKFAERAAELKLDKLIKHKAHFLYAGLATGAVLLATHLANIIDAAGGKNKTAKSPKIAEAKPETVKAPEAAKVEVKASADNKKEADKK